MKGVPGAAASILLLACLGPPARAQVHRTTTVPEKYFHGLGGGFVLYSRNDSTTTEYRPEECRRRLTPASTFKILNSLIGVETGVIPGEHYVIRWDSVRRWNDGWNRDHDLASAIANSVVWYYQELARRVGPARMRAAIEKTGFGNNDASGPVDRFWLGSTLLVSAEEEVGFLRRLLDGTLPFSARSLRIVKKIIPQDTAGAYVVHGKTGYSEDTSGVTVGWYVGYVETHGNTYVFALNMTTRDPERDGDRIVRERKSAAIAILRELGVP